MFDSFAFGVGLTVFPAQVCFGFEGSVDFRKGALFAFSSSELLDLEEKPSSSDNWTPTNVGFPSKSGSAEIVLADVPSKIRRSLTLMTLFFFLNVNSVDSMPIESH